MLIKGANFRCIGIVDQISDIKARKITSKTADFSFVLRNEQSFEPVILSTDELKSYLANNYKVINLYLTKEEGNITAIRCRDCALDKLPRYTANLIHSDSTYLIIDRDKLNDTYTVVDNNFTNMTVHFSKLIKAMHTKSISICNATLADGKVRIHCVDTLITRGEPVLSTVKYPKLKAELPEIMPAFKDAIRTYSISFASIYCTYLPPELFKKPVSVANRVKAAGILPQVIKSKVLIKDVASKLQKYIDSYMTERISRLLNCSTLSAVVSSCILEQEYVITFKSNAGDSAKQADVLTITLALNSDYVPVIKSISCSPAVERCLLPSYLYYAHSESEPIEFLIKKSAKLPIWIKNLYDIDFSVGHKVRVAKGSLAKMPLSEFVARLYVGYSYSCTSIPASATKLNKNIKPAFELISVQRNMLNMTYVLRDECYEELSSSVYVLDDTYSVVATSYLIDDHATGLVLTLCQVEKGVLKVIDAYGFTQTNEDEYSCEFGSLTKYDSKVPAASELWGFHFLADYYAQAY